LKRVDKQIQLAIEMPNWLSSALPFVPMLVESFRRLGAPGLNLLGDLADLVVQAGRPGLSRAAFISRARSEFSVALCWGNVPLRR
jgi:hypothetical protein